MAEYFTHHRNPTQDRMAGAIGVGLAASGVYAQSGISLNPYNYSMVGQLRPVSVPRPGGIIFTNGSSHVGIYLGEGQMISVMNPSQGTMTSSMNGGGMMTVGGYYAAPGI